MKPRRCNALTQPMTPSRTGTRAANALLEPVATCNPDGARLRHARERADAARTDVPAARSRGGPASPLRRRFTQCAVVRGVGGSSSGQQTVNDFAAPVPACTHQSRDTILVRDVDGSSGGQQTVNDLAVPVLLASIRAVSPSRLAQ